MITRICAAVLILAGFGMAQVPVPPPMHMGGPVFFSTFEHHRHGFPEWWKSPEMAQKIGISDAQVQKLDQVVLDHRLKMIDLHAALEREEVKLHPLMEAANPDENQILTQIDKVAAQRAQVEKANVQFMLAMRRVLTPEQWKKLKEARHFGPEMNHRFGGDHAPGGPRFFMRHPGPDIPKDDGGPAAPEHPAAPSE